MQADQENDPQLDDVLARIREALRRLTYGTLTVTVHEGRVVQVDRTEKIRLEPLRPRR
ncbi:MAG: YezD family protein [Myxococcaceae bacterium]